MFSQIVLFKITIGKGIGHIYKHDQRNWPYPYPNTNFSIPTCSDTTIKNQLNNDYGVSVGENYVSSAGLDQITHHHGNTDLKIIMILSHLRHLGKIVAVLNFLVIQPPQ